MVHNSSQLIDTLATTLPAARLSDASALAVLFLRRNAGMSHIVRLVRAEINSCPSATSLFRAPSLALVLLMRFIKLACADYVVDVLGTLMTTVCAVDLDTIDPDVALRDDDGATVRDRLAGLLHSLLDTLCNSAPLVSGDGATTTRRRSLNYIRFLLQLPGDVRHLLTVVHEAVAAKFEGSAHAVVCNILLDRLLLPALGEYSCLRISCVSCSFSACV